MKIKNNILSSFVKETSLSGENTLREVKLDFSEKGLTLTAVVDGNAIMVMGQLPSKSFEDYSELGKVGVINYSELLKVLGALKEDVTISKEGNLFVFKGGRTIEVPLADESLIKDINAAPKLAYTNTFKLNKEVFNEIENNVTFAMGKSDATNVIFEGTKDSLKIKYGTKYKFEDVVKAEGLVDDFSVRFGQPLINAMHNLSGELTVQMKSDFPITIIKKTDLYAVKIIVTPKV